MVNKLFVGFSRKIEFPRGGFLCLCDEVPDVPRSRVFDPARHSFNILRRINYRGATDFVAVIEALFPRGDGTLTKDGGLDHLFDCLEKGPRWMDGMIEKPDKRSSTGHAWSYSKIERILRSHVLRRVFCNPNNFSWNPRSIIFARINRAELSEFDALTLGLFLISFYKGPHIVIPDGGFYLRDCHTSLIREGRLIAGCNTLSELPQKVRAALLLGNRVPAGTSYDDAVELARYAGLMPTSNAYNDFISASMSNAEANGRQL